MSFKLSISDVNSLGKNQFVSVFGNVIELCVDAAVEVEEKRPFHDVDQLCNHFVEYLQLLHKDGQEVILNLHPDLAGRLAQSGELTKESTEEQKSAGLDQLTDEQRRVIDEYNKRYKERFGFPFIICARENKVQSIIDGLRERCGNTRDQEIAKAITEVQKICKLRILDLTK